MSVSHASGHGSSLSAAAAPTDRGVIRGALDASGPPKRIRPTCDLPSSNHTTTKNMEYSGIYKCIDWYYFKRMLKRKIRLVLFLTIVFLAVIWLTVFVDIDVPIRTCYQYNIFPTYSLNSINSTYVYPRRQLLIFDYNTLIDLSNFQFDPLSKFASFPTLLLVLVHSAPNNFDKRQCIRKTWGEKRTNLKVVFLLGRVTDWKLQRRLVEESEQFGDLVQGSFLDSYKNLTYKHVMALKYAIYHCPEAKYVLKVDDDVFVNMPVMMNILTVKLFPYGAKNLLLCEVVRNFAVKRNGDGWWRATYGEYFPPFCLGYAVLYSPDVLFILYRAAQKAKYFWIDDAFITGILAEKENIRHTYVNFLALPREYLKEIYIKPKTFLYGPVDLKVKEIYLLWEFVKNQSALLKYEEH